GVGAGLGEVARRQVALGLAGGGLPRRVVPARQRAHRDAGRVVEQLFAERAVGVLVREQPAQAALDRRLLLLRAQVLRLGLQREQREAGQRRIGGEDLVLG